MVMIRKMDREVKAVSIQDEILEIVGKFGFWIMSKNNMQGCAGYVHTPNRKIYIEVLFPADYPKSPVILNMPRDVRQHPNLYELIPQIIQKTTDPRIHTAQVLELIKQKIIAMPAVEMKERLIDELDEELTLVKSIYNVKTVEGKKYHIRIFYQLESKLNFEVEINYKEYPRKPSIIFHQGLEKIIGHPQALKILQNWNNSNPPHIVQIVQEIEHKFTDAHKIEDVQKLITIKNLTLVNEQNQVLTQKLSLSVLRGDIIGVYTLNKEIPSAFFKAFLGETKRLEGEINIFGKAPSNDLRQKVKFIDFNIPEKTAQKLDELSIEDLLNKYAPDLQKKEIKKRINTLLSIIGLSNRRKMKMGELSEGERRRVLIASSVINLPSIIFLVEPEEGDLNATEKKRIWDTITGINDTYSSTVFVYSTSEEIKRVHNILVLSRNGHQLGFGTITQLIGELPLMKEVIVIQFNEPNPEHVEILGKLPGLTFIIEERAGEKYRLFTKIEPNKVIPLIFQRIGSNIYNISKESPGLIDFVPYKRVQKQ